VISGGVHVLPAGLQDANGVPASSKQSANTRVSTQAGKITVLSDVFTWPGPFTVGNFMTPMSRVSINGVPAINASATGQAIHGGTGSPAPMTVTQTDQKVSGS